MTPPAVAGRARAPRRACDQCAWKNRFRRKDGSWRWIAWTMTADNSGALGSLRRPHYRRNDLQASCSKASASSGCWSGGVTDYALFMLDPNGIVTSWNAGAERIKGYTADEILGQHFSRFYTEGDRAAGGPTRAIATATSEGHSRPRAGACARTAAFWANVVIDPIRDEGAR